MTERCGVSVALVTGRARIGRTTIERLASEVALLAFCDLDTDVGENATSWTPPCGSTPATPQINSTEPMPWQSIRRTR